MMKGRSSQVAVTCTPAANIKSIKIGSARIKWIIDAATLTNGSTCAGNIDFVIRCPLLTSDVVPSFRALVDQIHGRSPANTMR
jgi:hypothetical protein